MQQASNNGAEEPDIEHLTPNAAEQAITAGLPS
jgi:hypothetical protein